MSEPMPMFRRVSLRSRLGEWESQVLARLREPWADASRRARLLRVAKVALPIIVIAGGVIAYFALRPVPKPDYERDALDKVFNYTLLTDEFNRLPVEERMRLIGQLVARLRDMPARDSMLLAAFASGIERSARAQIEENVALLAVDAWDKYARDYGSVPEQERTAYLEKTLVEFMKMMEAVGGRTRDISDEQRLSEARRQAQRDQEVLRDPERRPDNEGLADFVTFIQTKVAVRATPQQRVRGAQMMRDMTRMLRGQDVATGKPGGR